MSAMREWPALRPLGQRSNPQGGRSMHASEILFVGSGFRLFFNLLRGESRFSPCNREAETPGRHKITPARMRWTSIPK